MKLLITAILFVALTTAAIIPDPPQLGAEFDYNGLPDVDLRAYAEEAWEQGREDSALVLLDYIIESDLPDATAAKGQRDEWLAELAKRDSAMGMLMAVGWGAISGEVDSAGSMAGSTLADFFIYGDVRDAFKELFLEENTDEFILLLSAAGIATVTFPPADPAVSCLKTARKMGSLSEPLVKQLTKILKVAKESKNSMALAQLKEVFTAVYELLKNTKTWATFSTLLSRARNLDEVKLLAKIAGQTHDGAKRLSQLFAVALTQGKQQADEAVKYLQTYGQKGMDAMYGALRKGPDGLKFVAKHPTLTSRVLKGGRKVQVWGVNELTDWYHSLIYRFGNGVVWAKRAFVGLLFASIVMLWTPAAWLRRLSRITSVKGSGKARKMPVFANQLAVVLGIVLIVMAVYVVMDSQAVADSGKATIMTSAGGIQSSGGSSGETADLAPPTSVMLSILFIGFIVVGQVTIGFEARRRILKASSEGQSSAHRLRLLESQDTWLDLPLFVGLAGTILAFIFISLDAGISRMLAYSSTIGGILVAVIIRLAVYQPAREILIREAPSKEFQET